MANRPFFGSKSTSWYEPGPGFSRKVFLASMKSIVLLLML